MAEGRRARRRPQWTFESRLTDRLGSGERPTLRSVAFQHSPPTITLVRGHTDDEHVGEPLSSRELQTLELASRGWTNGEIARQLGVSVHAVKFHLASVYRKLGVANRTEAAVRFLEERPDRIGARS